MKKFGFKLLILAFAMAAFTVSAYADCSQGFKNKLINNVSLQDSSDVSKKANSMQMNRPIYVDNPLYNATMGGVGNFMQGMTGNPTNVYSFQDQERQRAEYVRQQN